MAGEEGQVAQPPEGNLVMILPPRDPKWWPDREWYLHQQRLLYGQATFESD